MGGVGGRAGGHFGIGPEVEPGGGGMVAVWGEGGCWLAGLRGSETAVREKAIRGSYPPTHDQTHDSPITGN